MSRETRRHRPEDLGPSTAPRRRRQRLHRRRRGGFPSRGLTLVEIMVGVGLALVIIVGFWALVSLAMRSFGSARKKLTNLQAANLLVERIDMDLRNLFYRPRRSVEISRKHKGRIAFYVLDDARSVLRFAKLPRPALKRIQYRFDGDTNRVYRKDGKTPEQVLPGTFESVAFFFAAPNFDPKRGPLAFNNFFNVRITCATESELRVNRALSSFKDARRKTRNVLTLIATVGAAMKASRNNYPVWKANRIPRLPARP